MTRRWQTTLLLAALATLSAPRAQAQTDEGSVGSPPIRELVAATADRGGFLPFTMTAALPTNVALVSGVGGYDAARKSAVMETAAEVRIWGPLSLRGGAVYSDGKNRLRPSIGARASLLNQSRHGIDGAIGVFYRPEGLTEPEGEIETVLSAGRQLGGGTLLAANLAYGQDPEGNERDGEVRLAVLHRFGDQVRAGFDGRWRFDLGSNTAKLRTAGEPTFDLVAGPLVSWAIGPVAISAQGGVSALRLVDATSTKLGLLVLGGLGSAF